MDGTPRNESFESVSVQTYGLGVTVFLLLFFKKAMYHLPYLYRYLAQFDLRYNNRIKLGLDDLARSESALKGAAGKRLTYRTTRRAKEAEEASRTMV